MTANTRSTQRFAIRLEVELGLDGTWDKGQTINISLGGVFVQTVLRPVDEKKVKLRVWLTDRTEPIETQAIVRWHTDAGLGLQFDGLRARDMYSLGRFLEMQHKGQEAHPEG